MIQRNLRVIAIVSIIGGLVWANARVSGQSKKPGEWPTYGGDLASTRYSPLDQITKENFNKLEVAWRFKTDALGPRPEFNFQGTPLMVDGVVYSTAGTRRAVVALDAGTGEMLWMHSEHEGKRGEAAPRQLSGRGLSYWPGTATEKPRIVYVTPGYQMVALDAKTGLPAAGFGKNGIVDLKEEDDQPIDLEKGEMGLHATPDHREGRHRRRRRASAWRRAEEPDSREGLHPGLRRADRKASLDLPHDSARRRVRQQHVGEGFLVVHRKRRRLGADDRGRRDEHRVPAGGAPDRRLLRRPSSRRRICSAKASSRSISRPVSASGTSSWCTTASGTWISRARRS